MGMYTELHFNAELIRKTPQQVLDVLGYMTGAFELAPATLPDHALFSSERWKGMLLCSSYYFPLSVASSIDWDDIAKSHYLRPMTISRVENGREIEGPTMRALLLWLDKQGRSEP